MSDPKQYNTEFIQFNHQPRLKGVMQCCFGFLVLCWGYSCQVVAADSSKFDRLIMQLEQGEVVFTNRVDSDAFTQQLKAALPANDPARLLRLNRELCSAEYLDTPEQGVAFANQFIAELEAAQEVLNLSHFYLCRALHYASQNRSKEQERDLTKALQLAEVSEDTLTQAQMLSYKAQMHSDRGQQADSLVLQFKAHELYKKLGHRDGIGLSVENIATAFRRMGEYEKAIEYLELSEKEFAAPGDQYRLGFLLQQKAFIYGELNKPDIAKQLFNRVRQIYQQMGEPTFVTATDIDLMWIANMEQRYGDSLELAAKVVAQLQAFEKQGEGQQVVNQGLFYLYWAEAFAGSGKLTESLQQFERAHQLISDLNNPRYLFWVLRAWSKTLHDAGMHQQAYQRLVEANQIQADLNSQAKQQRESLLRYQFDTALQDEKNNQLTAENKLSAQQVKVLESAQRWQYIAIGLFVILALIALFYAISQIQRNRQLHRLAMTDELTQVANRRSILWFAEQTRLRAVAQQQHWCLLLIDIDYFKQCNDSFGHDAGDQVLVQTAAAMKNLLRTSDRVGRTGGEEFLLVLPEMELAAATAIAERLRQVIEQLTFSPYTQVKITISVGVTEVGRQEDVREAMSRADAALYQAKSQGRNKVVAA
ncbi:MAG: diguanylate cyclase [Rheinheimera sp.]